MLTAPDFFAHPSGCTIPLDEVLMRFARRALPTSMSPAAPAVPAPTLRRPLRAHRGSLVIESDADLAHAPCRGAA